MKDIKELMMNMDTNLTREQAALDLSNEEKEELVSLINNIDNETREPIDSQCVDPDTCPTPTPTPPCPTNNVCTSQSFCCIVTFPKELTVLPSSVKAAVAPKELSLDPAGKCTVKIGNCTVILDKAEINGCAQVFMSLGIKDRCGNPSYVCCCDCVSLNKKNILCCGLPSKDKIRFIISDLNAIQLGEACSETKQVWQIKGNLTFTCGECV